MSLPVIEWESMFLVDGRGMSLDGKPSVGGLNYVAKRFFSLEVPEDLSTSPVHVIEAVALLVSVRLWLELLPSQSLVPIGSDNMAVVSALQWGKARDRCLGAMTRLMWGLFACHGSDCLVRYVPTDENKSDGLSRLNRSHVGYLLSQGWCQDHPSLSMFSLNEDSPFLFQEGSQGS